MFRLPEILVFFSLVVEAPIILILPTLFFYHTSFSPLSVENFRRTLQWRSYGCASR